MQIFYEDDQACLFAPALWSGKMSPAHSQAASRKARISGSSSKKSSELISILYQYLDLTPGAGNLLGLFYWEMRSPWRGELSILNTGPAPRSGAAGSSLWQILEEQPHPRYYLTKRACLGILRRSEERGKELPRPLKEALEVQAGLRSPNEAQTGQKSYHINQRSEGIDLDGISGALMATQNLQMQTFVTQPAQGIDGYNGDLTGDVSSTLGTNCGMSTGRNGVLQPQPIGIDSKHACATGDVASTLACNCGSSTGRNGIMMPLAFAQNQRDEVRDLHDVAGALAAQPGMKQQTFIAAGFCAEASKDARGIGCQEECAPTLKAAEKGPSVLCLNDQGGQVMSCSENVTGTLRAQEHGHQPLLLESNQRHATVRDDGISSTLPASMGMGGGYVPMVYENNGADGRFNGPLEVAPTMCARYGTGGNNVPLVGEQPKAFCVVGNIIDRQPENGGNGLGCQEDVSYTLTATDRHAVFSRQRVDVFQENDVVCTESARQHKDATDLVVQTYQQTVGTLGHSDHKGINNQYVGEDKCVVEGANLIRRLTPLECERLQGFPDGWTDIPGASDSARYKALGNSVAIPCVDFVVNGMAVVLREMYRANQPA